MIEFAHWLQTTHVAVTIESIKWLIPLLQSIHIVCIGVVVISSLMIALRMLGRVRQDESFATVWRRFAPWMWSGLAIMLLTGTVLIIGEPVREFTAISFWVKMSLVAITAIMMGGFGIIVHPSRLAPNKEFSRGVKAAAVGTMLLWLFIIFFGRSIAYDGQVWGSLSHFTNG